MYRVGFAVKDDEPIEYALATIKSSINNIWEVFKHGANGGRLFLTGKGNFRDKIATIQTYKGNRDPAQRPKYYSEIREYMTTYHNAEVVAGMEAEDAAGIAQYAKKDKSTVIVGVDKDLLCIPGYHYNPVKGSMQYVTMNQANYNFWGQVLTGDRVDNILGIPGMGPKTAAKVLAPCDQDWMKMRDATLQEYKKYCGDKAEQTMDETAKLIWILRKEGETYNGSSI